MTTSKLTWNGALVTMIGLILLVAAIGLIAAGEAYQAALDVCAANGGAAAGCASQAGQVGLERGLALAILVGGLGLNLAIVGPFLMVRDHVDELRRFLPRWLPW
jgi:hypothetical protein